MAETQEVKKTRAKRAKAAPKVEPRAEPATDLIEMAAATVAETAAAMETLLDAQPAVKLAAPTARPVEAGIVFSSVQEQSDALRQAMREAVTVSTRGVLEVNEKIIEAISVQNNAALDLWRNALSAPYLGKTLQTQADATRQVYETASAQWKDIAETTARWMTKSLEPFQSTLHRPGR